MLRQVSPRTLYETWEARLPQAPPGATTGEISPRNRLRRTQDIRHAVEHRGDQGTLLIIASSRVIASMPIQARPFVERVAALDEFEAGDAHSCGTYGWDSIEPALRGMVSLGLLQIV